MKIFNLVMLFLLSVVIPLKGYSSPYLEIGRTVVNSDNSFGGAGYIYKSKWDFNISLMGQGDTKNGHQDVQEMYSVSRIFKTNYPRLRGRVGLAYTPGLKLVGMVNYRVGIIWKMPIADLEYFHYSSGGIYKPNTGVDGILLRVKIN